MKLTPLRMACLDALYSAGFRAKPNSWINHQAGRPRHASVREPMLALEQMGLVERGWLTHGKYVWRLTEEGYANCQLRYMKGDFKGA